MATNTETVIHKIDPFNPETRRAERLASRYNLSFHIAFGILSEHRGYAGESRPATEYEQEMWDRIVDPGQELELTREEFERCATNEGRSVYFNNEDFAVALAKYLNLDNFEPYDMKELLLARGRGVYTSKWGTKVPLFSLSAIPKGFYIVSEKEGFQALKLQTPEDAFCLRAELRGIQS